MSQYTSVCGVDLVPPAVKTAICCTPYKVLETGFLSAKVVARYWNGIYTIYVLANARSDNTFDGRVFAVGTTPEHEFGFCEIDLSELAKVELSVRVGEIGDLIIGIELDDRVKPLSLTLGECFDIFQEEVPHWLLCEKSASLRH